MKNSIEKSTRRGYNSYLSRWFKYCARYAVDPLHPSNMETAYFLAWLFEHTDVSGDVAARCITAINHYFADNFIDWYQPKWITHLKRGFRALRPKKLRPKRPICHVFIYYFNKYYIPKRNIEFLSAWVSCLFGYYGGLRPNEFCKTRDGPTLKIKQVQWNPNADKPIEVIITLHKSKTNRYGNKFEQIPMKCRCGTSRFGYKSPCAVHLLKYYLFLRKERFGRFKLSDPLFINNNNTVLKYDMVRRFIKAGIDCVSKKTRISLDKAYYSPHCLRIGGCTDLSREGTAAHLVSRFGRWASDCWKQIYINLDFFDLARLRGETISDLRTKLFMS